MATTKKLILITLIILIKSLNGYTQFNRTYTSSINYKSIGYQICTVHAAEKTEVKIGIEFILESETVEIITLNQIWIFPKEIADEKGNKFKEVKTNIEKPTNENVYLSFTMNERNDLVKGKWKYRLYHKKKLLFEKEFWIE
jgi:hypothetical protein